MPNGTAVDTHDVEDPDLAIVRELTNHRRLNTEQANRRYRAILAVLAKNPDRSHAWLARKVGCSGSNISRLVGTACEALGLDRSHQNRIDVLQHVTRVSESVLAGGETRRPADRPVTEIPVDGARTQPGSDRDEAFSEPLTSQ